METTIIVLVFKCEWCGWPIEKAAGLLFSPPVDNMTRKHHMCNDCYELMASKRIIINP